MYYTEMKEWMETIVKCPSCKWSGKDTIIMSKHKAGETKLSIVQYCPKCSSEIEVV